jgi:hypothetical protein
MTSLSGFIAHRAGTAKRAWLEPSMREKALLELLSILTNAFHRPASGERSTQAFTALAANAAENLSPGQAAGSGSGTGTTPPSSGASGSPTSGNGAPGTPNTPAQNTANAASALSSQSFFGLGAAAMAVLALW